MSQSKLLVEEVKNREQEEVTLCWTIPNFKELCETFKAKDELPTVEKKFTVGEKLMCIPTHWKVLLRHYSKDMEVLLYFLGPGSASAKWNVSLKSNKGEFISFTCAKNVDLHKYDPSNNNDYGYDKNYYGFTFLKNVDLEKTFLTNGELQLKINVKVFVTPTDNPKAELCKDLKKGLDSGVGADMTFIFVEEEGSQNVIGKINAHRLILSLRSPVFATMFASGMKEATEEKIEICDMTPKSFRILLKFLYSGEVDEEWATVADELLYGSDKYELDGLKAYLRENIDSALTAQNVWKIRKLASLYKISQILKFTMNFIMENTEEVVEAVDDVIIKKAKML